MSALGFEEAIARFGCFFVPALLRLADRRARVFGDDGFESLAACENRMESEIDVHNLELESVQSIILSLVLFSFNTARGLNNKSRFEGVR